MEEEEEEEAPKAMKGKKMKSAMKKKSEKKSDAKALKDALHTVEKALDDGFGLQTHVIIKNLVEPCLKTPSDERITIQNQGRGGALRRGAHQDRGKPG